MESINKYTRLQIHQILWVMILFMSNALYAQTNSQPLGYEGTVGTAPVVMELSIDQNNIIKGR